MNRLLNPEALAHACKQNRRYNRNYDDQILTEENKRNTLILPLYINEEWVSIAKRLKRI